MNDIPRLRLVTNESRTNLRTTLSKELASATRIDILVAYAKQSGFEDLHRFLVSSDSVYSRLLIGLGFGRTEPPVLSKLLDLSSRNSKLKVRVFLGGSLSPEQFHPKLYVLNKGSVTTMIIGSSNLTSGGLEKNVEANFLLLDKTTSDMTNQVVSFVDSVWNSPSSVPLTKDIVDDYERAFLATRDKEMSVEKEFRNLRRRLAVKHVSKSAGVEDVIEEIRVEAQSRGLSFDDAPNELPRSRYSFKVTGLPRPIFGVVHRSDQRVKYPDQIWVGVLGSSWKFLQDQRSFVVVVDVLRNHTFFIPIDWIRSTSTGYGTVRAFRIKKEGEQYFIYENHRNVSDHVDRIDVLFE